MNIALWTVTVLLVIAHLAGGVALLALPKERFRQVHPNWRYVDEFSPGFLKGLGIIKLAAGAGLLLPPLFDVAPVLVPLAATGLVLLIARAWNLPISSSKLFATGMSTESRRCSRPMSA